SPTPRSPPGVSSVPRRPTPPTHACGRRCPRSCRRTSSPADSSTVFSPVGQARTHRFEDALDHFLYAQDGRIQIHGVRSLRQRRVRAGGVALVALLHLGGKLPHVDGLSLGAHLFTAADRKSVV